MPQAISLLMGQNVSILSQVLATTLYLVKRIPVIEPGDTFSPDQIKMVYWQVNSPEAPIVFDYSNDAYRADELYLEKLVSEILTFEPGDFLKTSDQRRCKFCNYRSLCDRGDLAGPLSEFDENQESRGLEEFNIDLNSIDEIAILGYNMHLIFPETIAIPTSFTAMVGGHPLVAERLWRSGTPLTRTG